jgi:hypothetical protein
MFVLECSMPLEWLLICYLGENIRCWVWIIMASYRPVQHGNNSCSLRFESSNARHALLYTVHWSASKAVLGIVTVIALSPSPSPRKQKIILSQGVTLLFIEGVHLDSAQRKYTWCLVLPCITMQHRKGAGCARISYGYISSNASVVHGVSTMVSNHVITVACL